MMCLYVVLPEVVRGLGHFCLHVICGVVLRGAPGYDADSAKSSRNP